MKNALALLALAVPAAAQIPELQWARSPDSGWWFGFTPITTTWHEGEALGVANGGHLATIRSAAEDAWLGNVIASLGAYDTWIGLNDITTEGQFVWASGLPITYTSWGPNEPNPLTTEHDATVKIGSQWFLAPPSSGQTRPVIERQSLPPEGWRTPIHQSIPLTYGDRIELGDVDGDGNLDVVVGSRTHSSTGPTFAVLRGLGGGAFAPGQAYGSVPTSNAGGDRIAVGDYDADGHDDVALTTNLAPRRFLVYFAGPNSDFATTWSPTPDGVFDHAGVPAAGDLDGDGRDDLLLGITGPTGSPRILCYRSDPAGAFLPPIEYALPAYPGFVSIVDLDGDHDLDWVVTHTNAVTAFLNDGTATSPTVRTTTVPGPGGYMAFEDYDRDGFVDVAMTSLDLVRVFWGDGAGGFDPAGPSVMSAQNPSGIASADFDGDGWPDLCVASTILDQLRVVRGTGAGTFSQPTSLYAGFNPFGMRAADFDGDGRPELVTAVEGAPGQSSARLAFVRRFAIDCDADGIDDTSEIHDDPALDADLDRELDACAVAGESTCLGDGSGLACPCGNASAPGAGEGCAHSFGNGGRLEAHGLASLSSDSVRLDGSRMPNSSALYFQGTTSIAGGLGDPFGDGLRCAGGSLVRLGTRTNLAGASGYPDVGELSVSARGGVVAPGSRTYQVWYRNAATFCTASTFNLTNGVRIEWIP